MTAIPPMTIHGAPLSVNACESASSARSTKRSLLPRLPGILRNTDPATAHLFHGALTHRIAGGRPLSLSRERSRGR